MDGLVSILIPTFKRKLELERCLLSIERQTYENIEIVISDNDPHSDISYLRLKSLTSKRLIYHKNKSNIGPILNWRKAFELSKGEFCVILPDDDYLINDDYLADSVRVLANPEISLVITACILGYSEENQRISTFKKNGVISGEAFFKGFWSVEKIPTIANVFKRSLVEETDSFLNNAILYSDIEFWLKSFRSTLVYKYSKPSVFYSFHGGNIVLNMNCNKLIENSKFIGNVKSYYQSKGYGDIKVDFLLYRYIVRTSNSVECSLIEFTKKILDVNGMSIHDLGYLNFFKIVVKYVIKEIKKTNEKECSAIS